jgi:hypothetical protein
VKPRLDNLPIPEGAEERARSVAMAAFAERKPSPRERNLWRPAVVVVAVAALAGILASPPGRSVIQSIREAVGVKKAQRELFSLPAAGQILVDSSKGPWLVDANGSRRHLGSYREASWSPYGRFIVAAGANELVTLDPAGNVRWVLARSQVRLPRWGGSRSDTRIAYFSGRRLRIVAGDGTGDHLLDRGAAEIAPAWQPWKGAFVLAYVGARGVVRVVDIGTGRLLWSADEGNVQGLRWSADGNLLAIRSRGVLSVWAGGVRLFGASTRSLAPGNPLLADAFSPAGGVLAYTVYDPRSDRTALDVLPLLPSGQAPGGEHQVFSGTGRLRSLAWSPDGRWLLVTWPDADQWIFVSAQGAHAIRAFSGITRQFGSGSFPVVAGWVGK